MSSIALSGSQIYISGFVFVFKDTFLDMCTMAKIKKHERENKMIACRSRPSPAHRTSPSGGSRRGGGPCAPGWWAPAAGVGGGGPPDVTPQQRGQQRLSWTFSEEEEEEEKKPQMPKEFQWVEVPPPLREYLCSRWTSWATMVSEIPGQASSAR